MDKHTISSILIVIYGFIGVYKGFDRPLFSSNSDTSLEKKEKESKYSLKE